jgi:general secretion pathway protein D
MRSVRVALLVVSVSLSCASFAAPPDAPLSDSASYGSEGKATDLRVLLVAVGKKVHKHFLTDPRAPASIDLAGLKADEVTYPILLAALRLHGFVVIQENGLLEVVPDANARQYPMPLVNPDNIRTDDDEWVTAIVQLKTVSAAQLVPVLRPLMPQNAQLSAVTGRNALIIADSSANVRRMVEIARGLDALPPPKTVEQPRGAESKPEP